MVSEEQKKLYIIHHKCNSESLVSLLSEVKHIAIKLDDYPVSEMRNLVIKIATSYPFTELVFNLIVLP